MTDEKTTFTVEEVDSIVKGIQFRERVISALLTAIQRSTVAGDDPIYTNVLRVVLDAQLNRPQSPVLKPEEDPDAPSE